MGKKQATTVIAKAGLEIHRIENGKSFQSMDQFSCIAAMCFEHEADKMGIEFTEEQFAFIAWYLFDNPEDARELMSDLKQMRIDAKKSKVHYRAVTESYVQIG